MPTQVRVSERELRKKLEAFVSDNQDLERLESLVTQFNIFEAVGAVRQELRHSDFLAYLLTPYQNHSLGDTFVRKLLQKAVSLGNDSVSITAIDLDTWNLDELEVLREHQSMDILLTSESNRFVVVIENKIDAAEHSDQLGRYLNNVRNQYKDYKILAIYLTPEGDKPSHGDFVSLSYERVANLIEQLVETRKSSLGPEVRILMKHYTQMLRRHIVTESEIADLCRRIYRKHAQAIDLIVEHRPDEQAGVREVLQQLIDSSPKLVADSSTKNYVRFALKAWDVPKLKEGSGWTRTGRTLLFEFQNLSESLKLKLIIGPGPQEVRNQLLQVALQKQPPFKPASATLNRQFNEIYSRSFLAAFNYSGAAEEDLATAIRGEWTKFLENDLPLIENCGWL